MRWGWAALILGVILIALAVVRFPNWKHFSNLKRVATWQQFASPGPLSAAHASLEGSCAACHTSGTGVDAVKCIACHANNESLLQRQPTAFHADMTTCRACHGEHQGSHQHPTQMVHAALAQIGLQPRAEVEPARDPGGETRAQLLYWIREQGSTEHGSSRAPRLTPEEAVLRCETCHDTKDRHVGLFGKDCAACHETTSWRIAEFQHPSPRSLDCAQCHQAPPSHYMGHFHMVSKRVAGLDKEENSACCGPVHVTQCYRCHQTTSWNDIKGVGWYKHH